MKGRLIALALASLSSFALGASAQDATPAAAPIAPEVQRTLDRLRTAALADDNGYSIVQDLVTRVGPRQAGSPAEARARDWAVAMLRAQGFSGVHMEPFTEKAWHASLQTAAITAPIQQQLVIAALGGTASTPEGGLEAEVVRFPNLNALRAAPEATVRGRFVFIDEPMARSQDASGYGAAVLKRALCGQVAQTKGAAGCLIRSVGTNQNRFAHQGQARPTTLPAAALSPPDSDVLARLLQAGGLVRVRLNVTTETHEEAPSGNVIGEVRGRSKPNEIVLVSAHLDSWDLGHGAIDDGAGVAIVTAAARLINNLPRHPKRTIRVLLAGSEEIGGNGGEAYAVAHRNDTHIVVGESDLGADSVWRVRTFFGAQATPYARAIQGALAPLAIVPGDNGAVPGTDVEPTQKLGVPAISLNQDASRYFDYHHTADDTLDKIDPERLRQNIAAWAIFLYLAAEQDWDFRAGGLPPAPE